MPDWGKQGVLTQAQAEMMAKFLQNDPPTPPEMSLAQMKETWKVFLPPEKRPTAPQHKRDWQDFFAVTLRDAGQVAIIDGDTFEVVSTVDTGYAVHISRMSATGRYVYVIGRDGRATLIDLWLEKPDKVAEVKLCYDARSIESSKYKGPEGDFSDKYAIVGCYWPPHFVIMDGLTLEPFKIVSTRSYTYDTEEYHPEPRVAAIVASHFKPEWIVNIKETGQVWLVNYTDPNAPTIKMLEAERFLHDGGWDSTRRYFLVAANQANKIAVVDAKEGKMAAIVETSKIPHPGRGANWIDPEFGPVWSTSHLGEGSLVAIGTDPEGHPDQAWKVVRDIPLPGARQPVRQVAPQQPVDLGGLRPELGREDPAHRVRDRQGRPDQDEQVLGDSRLRPRRALRVQQRGHAGLGQRVGPGRPAGQDRRDRDLRRQDAEGGRPCAEPGDADREVQRVQHGEGYLLRPEPEYVALSGCAT